MMGGVVVFTDIGGIRRLKNGETVQGWINRLDEDDIEMSISRDKISLSDYPFLFIKPQQISRVYQSKGV